MGKFPLLSMNDITFREATLADSPLILAWRNDPVSRQFSFDKDVIALETHEDWFNRNHRKITMIEADHKTVGQLRMDDNQDLVEVSITIDPSMRSRGIGSSAIKSISHEKKLVAHILPINIPSIIAFLKGGFRFVSIELVKGFRCYRMER